MKYILKNSSLFIILFLFGCTDQDDNIIFNNPVCDNSNTEFKQMFTGLLLAPTTHESTTLDNEVHEYSFRVATPKKICSLGYQSNHDNPSTPYVMEIVNNDTNVVLYSGSHVFSKTATSYVSLASTVSLSPNVSYSIRRIQTNWDTNAFNICGRLILCSDPNLNVINVLPMTLGDLTITSSNFHDLISTGSGPVTHMLPYIDIVFEN